MPFSFLWGGMKKIENLQVDNTESFSASWDRGMWVFNCLLVVVLIGISTTLFVAGFYGFQENLFLGFFLMIGAILPIVILIFGAAFAPKNYKITSDNILINRLWVKDIKIPLIEVYSVEPVDYKFAFKRSIRIFGSGGGFGIYGDFSSRNIKYFKAYMTRRDKLVMIKTPDKPFILTPDDPESFIAAVKRNRK
jgi:uncharacterized membrane protein